MRTLLIALLLCTNLSAHAKDQILVLSGGDDPGLNHYSQYLQTKTLYEYLVAHMGDAVSLYFGVGNSIKSDNQPLDVHKIINTTKDKHNKQDQMLAGIIPNNNAATKNNVISYFLSPKVQTMRAEDTLFLFVSDHGMPYAFLENKNANPTSNNCIDLWHYEKPFINNFATANDFYNACLSKNELTALLNDLPVKHVIFQMSQCFSGGFHQMSVQFKNGYPVANSKLCGFTAAPPDHYASGCTPDANGATYQGYERSFTEWYTGIGILTGKKLRNPAPSIDMAHQNATLEDMTVDVPLSTSNYYLLQWVDLWMSNNFVPRVPNYSAEKTKQIYLHYLKYLPQIKNADLQNFVKLAQSSAKNSIKIFPKAAAFALLPLEKQSEEISKLEQHIDQKGVALDVAWDGMMAIYLSVVAPAWELAINQHQVDFLSPKEYAFEREFYQPIVSQNLYKHPYQFDMFFLQYLSHQKNDKALLAYQKNRYELIKKWAVTNKNQTLVNAITKLKALDKTQQDLQDTLNSMEKNKQFLKRILTYNQIIAAWTTLLVIHDKIALDDLEGLLTCEHTKNPFTQQGS